MKRSQISQTEIITLTRVEPRTSPLDVSSTFRKFDEHKSWHWQELRLRAVTLIHDHLPDAFHGR